MDVRNLALNLVKWIKDSNKSHISSLEFLQRQVNHRIKDAEMMQKKIERLEMLLNREEVK